MLSESNPESAALAVVHAYHARTKHRLDRYAPGPETLDWDAQPAPFRHYQGTERTLLPLLSELAADDPAALAMNQPFEARSAAPGEWTLSTLGVWLQVSLGLTAWKRYGPDRWALRANPSSGNLHPIEGYVLAQQLPFLPDGLYHYDPEQHALELRAHAPRVLGREPPSLSIALTSIMWREAWKYGERAFRYCQLDAGHALTALSVAANVLGAQVSEQTHVGQTALGALLGLDRDHDFARSPVPDSEREEPELLLRVDLPGSASAGGLPVVLPAPASLTYYGVASTIDPRPMYRWPMLAEVATATRCDSHRPTYRPREPATASTTATATAEPSAATLRSARSTRSVLLGRRSAQRFDSYHELQSDDLAALLGAVMPGPAALWQTLAAPPGIDLVLFIHRVAGLECGLYYLPRRGPHSADLRGQLSRRYTAEPSPLPGSNVPLLRLCTSEPKQLMRVARTLHCHQDIAATGCLTLGMIADLEPRLTQHATGYRDLLREAGLIGQLLYLQAEARGLRGTGIGCYFDDAVHDLLGLRGARHQSLYHFTLGRALDDSRLETEPAYDERSRT